MHHAEYSIDGLWQEIKDRLDAGQMITCSSQFGTGRDFDQDSNGISYNHFYAVDDAVQLEDGTKLLSVKDPLGFDQYVGPFSDESERWTSIETTFEHASADDGRFWIDAKTYHESMRLSVGNREVAEDKMTYFAALNVSGELYGQVKIMSNED